MTFFSSEKQIMFHSSDNLTLSRFYPTEAELTTYRDLARAFGTLPSEAICRCLGPDGQQEWTRVDTQARTRWPDLPQTGKIAFNGKTQESLPECIVSQIFDSLKHDDMESIFINQSCLTWALRRQMEGSKNR